MTWETLSNIIAADPYSCAIYAKKFDLSICKHGNNSKGMPEQQEDSSDLSGSPSTGNPRQQRYKTGWEAPRD